MREHPVIEITPQHILKMVEVSVSLSILENIRFDEAAGRPVLVVVVHIE